MYNIVFATSQKVIGDTLFVSYSNGQIKAFDILSDTETRAIFDLLKKFTDAVKKIDIPF